ncbi:RING-type domain-containing protein [Psidium guajava]|nr:RING-type domain-containing protein [Psidium guajava]
MSLLWSIDCYGICFWVNSLDSILLPCRYVEAGTVMTNYAHFFDILTHLRQVLKNRMLFVQNLRVQCRSHPFMHVPAFAARM